MKEQKSALTLVCSIVLIVCCLFSAFACVRGLGDVSAIKNYKTTQREEALASIDELTAGIAQLGENEAAYFAGVESYNEGLASYTAGQEALAAGQQKLEAGEAQYAAAQQTLAAARTQYAQGKAALDAKTEEYNQGKAQLEQLKPMYEASKDVDSEQAKTLVAQYEAGLVQIKTYEAGLAQLNQAQAQIAAGEKQLAAAKAELDTGYASAEAAKAELAAGKAKLEEGEKQLAEFEKGTAQAAAGLETLMASTETTYRSDGTTVIVTGVKERLGEDFSYWALDENGKPALAHEKEYLDLEKCALVCDTARQYIDEQTADTTGELTGRVVLYIIALAACVLALVAGIVGLAGKNIRLTAILAIASAIAAIAANVFGLVKQYAGYTYLLEDGSYSGTLQLTALLTLGAVTVIIAIVMYMAYAKNKKAGAEQEA